jgi:uncharacterized protein
VEFEWDQAKDALNRTNHGISFHDASSAFADPLSLTIPDPDHSEGEYRYVTLGYTSFGRLVVVSHTERGDRIRIISARSATASERASYESG